MAGLSVAIYKRFSIGINLLIIQPFVFILYINALSVDTKKKPYIWTDIYNNVAYNVSFKSVWNGILKKK